MNKRTMAVSAALLLLAGIYIGSKFNANSSALSDEYKIRAKNFVRRINRKDFDACFAALDDVMKNSTSSEKLSKTFTPVLEALGDFKRFRSVSVSKRESYICTVTKCEYENGPASFTILFDSTGAVGGIYVK